MLIETPVLFICLGKRYTTKQKLLAGLLLTACSYPFVVFIFPLIWDPYKQFSIYAFVSEAFAPLSECFVFYLLFQRVKQQSQREKVKDYLAVLFANLMSFLSGLILQHFGVSF